MRGAVHNDYRGKRIGKEERRRFELAPDTRLLG
jgi:hypothetical protein